jgi:hypothetical protein
MNEILNIHFDILRVVFKEGNCTLMLRVGGNSRSPYVSRGTVSSTPLF